MIPNRIVGTHFRCVFLKIFTIDNMILRVINNIICIEHSACQGMTNDTEEILHV